MSVSYEFDGQVVLVTGGCGALGSAVAERFDAAGATVCVSDVLEPGDPDAQIDADHVNFDYFPGDL
ncbi:MAG: glucose 1-dehydrogenase, partial [Halobacteriales archaeon]|nr:glucose 1-dehydrogenase [Halobacteriales archaeon]